VSPWLIAGAALAGGVGAGLRYLIVGLVMRRVAGKGRAGRFPLGILVVNVTGSFALGLLTGLGASIVPADLAFVIGTGLLGGYTTLSTVSVESVLLAQRGRRTAAVLNLAGTLALSLAAAGLGVVAGS
jgi:CrcB protein